MSVIDSPLEVRQSLLDALQVDLIGPSAALGDHREALPQAPSRWYLTGFLVPTDADEEQRFDPNSDDEVDQTPAVAGVDENEEPEKSAARRSYLPSSLGLSVLVPESTGELQAVVRFGEYLRVEQEPGQKQGDPVQWRRNPHEEIVSVSLGDTVPGRGVVEVPGSRGVEVVWSLRGVPDSDNDDGLPKGTRSLSMFVVNRRKASPDEVRDEGFIFQVELEIQSDESFIARPNLHSLESEDWDERVADLQYRDCYEFSVGHSVATECDIEPLSTHAQVFRFNQPKSVSSRLTRTGR